MNNLNAVNKLIELGSDINRRNNKGYLALDYGMFTSL